MNTEHQPYSDNKVKARFNNFWSNVSGVDIRSGTPTDTIETIIDALHKFSSVSVA